MTTKTEHILDFFKDRKFRSVNPGGKNQSYGSYKITGAQKKWKSQSDFVYSYETRVAGPKPEVESFINSFTDDDLELIQEILGEDKYEHIKDVDSLLVRLIGLKNYNKSSKLMNSAKDLYEYELSQLKQIKPVKKQDFTIDQYYQAFLKYKETQKNIQAGKVQTKRSPKVLRTKEIGDLYKKLTADTILNVYNYSEADGKAEIISIDDYDKTKLYKVPNYKIVASRKKDVEYVLRDLISLGVIALKKSQISGVVDSWSNSKTNPVQVEAGPPEIKNTNTKKKAPVIKTKLVIKK